MKVENFSAAVEFYSKAIALNPENAVYYCNRYTDYIYPHMAEAILALVNTAMECIWSVTPQNWTNSQGCCV